MKLDIFACPYCTEESWIEDYKSKGEFPWRIYQCPICKQIVELKYSSWRTFCVLVILAPMVAIYSVKDPDLYPFGKFYPFAYLCFILMTSAIAFYSAKIFLIDLAKTKPMQYSIRGLVYFTVCVGLVLLAGFKDVAWPIQAIYSSFWILFLRQQIQTLKINLNSPPAKISGRN